MSRSGGDFARRVDARPEAPAVLQPGDLQPLLRTLATASSVAAASDAACDHLAELEGALLPSLYFERDGVLRCQSQRGYWQVLDGIRIDAGILARVYRTGEAVTLDDVETDLAALRSVPGVRTETCVPLHVRGVVVGVLNVESEQPFADGVAEHVARCAEVLSSRLDQLWVGDQSSPLERLARTSRELAGLTDETEIHEALVRLACQVIGMSSSVLILRTGDGALRIVAAHGPLAAAFHRLSPADLVRLRDTVSRASSWYTKPAGDAVRSEPATEHLRAAGVASLAAVPIRGLGGVDPVAVVGFLATADADEVGVDTADVEALELLADEGARCLQLAVTVADLRARASRDPLTGLGNHRSFHETLAAAEGGGRYDWAVLLADLDGFKEINDRHGHLRGDHVLRDLAAALQTALRAGERAFRVGGDEFAFVLRARDGDRVSQVAQRLCDAAHSVLEPYGASMSIGAALPRGRETCIATLERADAALYTAKRTEPGSFVVSDRETG